MMSLVLLLTLAQGTAQTAPQANPYGPGGLLSATSRASSPQGNRPQGRRGPLGPGLWVGGAGAAMVQNQTPPIPPPASAPTREDPLRELILNPVYEKEKHTPKLIELP
jgi:hypothetical protein